MTRIPRPTGITHLASIYHNTQDKKDKERLNRELIKAYLNGTFLWPYTQQTHLLDREANEAQEKKVRQASRQKNNQQKENTTLPTPITQYRSIKDVRRIEFSDLAMVLGLTQGKLMARIEKMLARQAEQGLGNQSRELADGQRTRALMFGLLEKSLYQALSQSDWGLELQAVARLKGYHVGSVMAANTALSQATAASKAVFDMAKVISPYHTKQGTGPAIVINNQNKQGDQIEQQFVTTTMAMKMIEEQGLNGLPRPNEMAAIYLEQGIGDTPEVKAIGADAQGVKKIDPKDLIFQEGKAPNTNHEDRRALELDIEDGHVE